jgi:hypothetical protein
MAEAVEATAARKRAAEVANFILEEIVGLEGQVEG